MWLVCYNKKQDVQGHLFLLHCNCFGLIIIEVTFATGNIVNRVNRQYLYTFESILNKRNSISLLIFVSIEFLVSSHL